METFETPYGSLTLYSNEKYISHPFRSGRYWNQTLLDHIRNLVDPAKHVVIVGGHCGASALAIANMLGPSAKVFVMEPQSAMFSLLCRNIADNGMQERIVPICKAAFSRVGTANMHVDDEEGGVVAKRIGEEQHLPCNFGGISLGMGGEQVETVTLDSMNFLNIGLLFLDAQGADRYILSGATRLLEQSRPIVVHKWVPTWLLTRLATCFPEEIHATYFDPSSLGYREKTVVDGTYSISVPGESTERKGSHGFPRTIYLCDKTVSYLERKAALWKTLNPDHTVECFDNARCEAFLRNEFSQVHADLFRFIPDGPIRADFWRVCILYRYGGIYSDADNLPFLSLDAFVEPDVDFLTCSTVWTGMQFNPNLIAAHASDPVLEKCILTYLDLYQHHASSYSYWGWSIMTVLNQCMQLEHYPMAVKVDGVYLESVSHRRVQILKECRGVTTHYEDYNVYEGLRVFNNRSVDWNENEHSASKM